MKKLHGFTLSFTLVIAGCAPEQIKVAPIAEPTSTSLPPVPIPTPIPTPILTPRQKRRARAAKLRQERAERRRIAAETRRREEAERKAEQKSVADAAEWEAQKIRAAHNDGIVSKSEYDEIKIGMTLGEAMDILGLGEEVSRSEFDFTITTVRQWSNSDGSNMNAIFQNNALVSKAQAGLK